MGGGRRTRRGRRGKEEGEGGGEGSRRDGSAHRIERVHNL